MRAATMKERPSFTLMRQTDIQSVYHMQMPRWLFSDPRYADMNLDTKVAYTFLLNRFQLSRRNSWINEYGEVFVIFPRKELAAELRVCEQRVTAAFRQLTERKLIWEKRCGRGDANQIYLATVQPEENMSYSSAPFLNAEEECDPGTADLKVLSKPERVEKSQEPRKSALKNLKNNDSRAPDIAATEPPELRPSYIDKRKREFSQKEVSLSVAEGYVGGQADDDEEELNEILDGCELDSFPPETARIFENAIERLFYSDSLRVGNATLPQKRVRAKLHLLGGIILQTAESKLTANLDHTVRNSTAYTMSTIFNCITEHEGDLLVDPYLNSLRAPPGT